ncbi:MAG: hypothetical protein M3Q24_02080 [bacterium]|nr:hypothetical protein [bacterium]
MILNKSQKIALAFLVMLIALWSYIHINSLTGGFYNYLYSFLFGLIPLIGGIYAMIRSSIWGRFSSAVGKAVFFVGLGLFFWGAGETIWSYYNFILNVPAPYPSIADIGFAPSIFFYSLGAAYLSSATGAKYVWRSSVAKILIALTLIIVSAISYYVLVNVARGGVLLPEGESPLKTILDLAYPLGDFIGLMIAVVISGLSFKYLGGAYKKDIYSILLGLGVMFIADSIFSYTTTVGTYYNANFGDLMLTLGLFFLTFGVLGFTKIEEKIR